MIVSSPLPRRLCVLGCSNMLRFSQTRHLVPHIISSRGAPQTYSRFETQREECIRDRVGSYSANCSSIDPG